MIFSFKCFVIGACSVAISLTNISVFIGNKWKVCMGNFVLFAV